MNRADLNELDTAVCLLVPGFIHHRLLMSDWERCLIFFFPSPYFETDKYADPERKFGRGILFLFFCFCDT